MHSKFKAIKAGFLGERCSVAVPETVEGEINRGMR
jgi:hypothetical protein